MKKAPSKKGAFYGSALQVIFKWLYLKSLKTPADFPTGLKVLELF